MPNRIPAEGKYNFIDLFAGAGGLSEGFIQAGFNPIAHVEMNSFAAQTLVTRSAYYYLKQVKQLDIYYQYLRGEITRDAFLEKIPNRITKTVICETMSNDTLPGIFKTIDGIMKLRNMQSVDVVIGGPPCQAYSLVGRAQSSHMDHPMSEDPRNELYKLYARVLKRYQPRMFVFENVMGISSANEGTTFKNLKKYLRRVGYEIEWHEQNSKSFGVLQNRRRMIIVGWLKNSGMAYPEFLKKESPFTVNDLLSDLPKLKPGLGSSEYRTKTWSKCVSETEVRTVDDVLTLHKSRPNKERDIEIYKRAIELWNDGHKRLNYNDLPEELKTHKNRHSFVDRFKVVEGDESCCHTVLAHLSKDMCTYGDKRIKPKYVVSTATIKNASEQTRCLYARQSTAQFPPNGFEIGDSFFINEISTKDDPFRKYVGVCAPGQSVKTTLLRMYAIILQTSYQLAQQDEYKNVIDPYYSLVGYYNSIRELGGAVRLLQDDIPKRIYRIKTKYNMDKVRYLNKKVEITSRMSSYEIPNKLRQLEATCDSKDCLDTAVATNMIAVGMDVDRLGLMVVTGQPKQNSEYIQATSRIGRAFPGLVFTLYNPYRPRDLSHYENFTGYHSQLYRFVEGTTATPFSARARDRVMHALIISAIRLKYPEMASNERAADIAALSDIQMSEIKALILDRLNIVKPEVRLDAENEIDQFIDWWKMLAAQGKPLRYYVYGTDKYNRLMNYYGQSCKDTEKATLSSMREVENAANMFYYTEE